ncbi:MAG TPA: Ig-like domain-containing protein [Candidatus Dormibacteraeota bacterium]|nr:Ig-like domain-containing protein [Candidatus Dormibacteraeota bacterium]
MKARLREAAGAPTRRRRIGFWLRAGIGALGALSAAGGLVLGATGHPVETHVSTHPAVAPPMAPAAAPLNRYWMVAADGGIFSFGGAPFFGSTGAIHLNKPIVGMAATPSGNGYWFVASDGGVFNFGDAGFYGSTGAIHLNQPVVGMAATPSGHGYWLVAADGGIFNFGDAGYFGSTGAIHLNKPIVGLAASPSGNGYWFVASDGGIFNYGDAAFHGSAGAVHLNQPVVGMARTPDGGGYWLVASDGGIFSYGNANFYGSTGAIHLNQPIAGMTPSPTGGGYWFVASDGGIFNYGDAGFAGSMGATKLNQPVVGMAGQPTLFGATALMNLSASSIAADGISQVTGVTRVTDPSGTPVPGDNLNFSVSGAGCGSVSPASAVTDMNGVAVFNYAASSTVATCTVHAVEAFGSAQASRSITQAAGAPSHVTATPSASTYTADQGHGGIPATFTVTDAHGNPLRNVLLDVTTTLPNGLLNIAGGLTNSSGLLTVTVTDTTAGDIGTVTAAVHGTSLQGTTGTIGINPGAFAALGQPTVSSQAVGTKYTVPVTASDAYSNPVNPAISGFTFSGTAMATAPDGVHTATAVFEGPFSGGTALLDVTSYRAGSDVLTISNALITTSTSAFNIAPGAVTGIAASPSSAQSLTADQMASTGVPVAFTVTDQYGNGMPGLTLALTTTGAGFSHASPALPATKPTGDGTAGTTAGVAAFLLHDTNIADAGTITATIQSTTTKATTGAITITPGALTTIGLSAITSPQAAGTAYSTTVTTTDAYGNAINPDTTTFNFGGAAVNAGPDGHHPATAMFAAPFSGGHATLNVTSYAAATGATLIVSDAGVNQPSNTFTVNAAAPSIVTPTPGGPAGYTADQGTTGIALTFDVTDAYGNALGNVPLTISKTGLGSGAITGPAGTGDGTGGTTLGHAAFTLADSTVETGTVTATVGSTSVKGTTGTISITPGAFTSLAMSTITAQTAGTPFTVTITGLDAHGNHVNPPSNTVTFTGSALNMAPDGVHHGTAVMNGTFSGGQATASVTAYERRGAADLTATDSGIAAPSNAFAVNAAPASTVAPTPSSATSRTADQMAASGVPISFVVKDAYANLIPGQAIAISTTPANTAFSHANPALPTSVNTGTGSGGTTLGVVSFTLTDTNTADGGTITATAPSTVAGTTASITITPGKVASITVAQPQPAPPSYTAGTLYKLNITVKDNYGNGAQPPVVDLVPSGSAMDTAPDGTHTATAVFEGPFSASGAGTLDVTSYKAESASLTLTDTASAYGGSATGTNATPYTVAAAAASQVIATSSSFVGGTDIVLSGTGGGTGDVSLASTDAYQNPQPLPDTLNLTLTKDASGADKGKLKVGGTTSLVDDSTTQVTMQVVLSGGGTGSFTYVGVNPYPASGAGTITIADATHPAVTTPTIGVQVTTVAAVSVLSVQCTTCTADTGNAGISLTFKAVDAGNTPVSGVVLDVTKSGFAGDAAVTSPVTTGGTGQAVATLTEHTVSTGFIRAGIHGVPSANVNLVTATPTIVINPGALHHLAIATAASLPPAVSYPDQTAGQQSTLYVDALDQFGNLTPMSAANLVLGGTATTTKSPAPTLKSPDVTPGAMSSGQEPVAITSYAAASGLTFTAGCVATCVPTVTATFNVLPGTTTSIAATPKNATQYTTDQGNSPGIPVTFTTLDAWSNPTWSIPLTISSTGLGHASGVATSGTTGSSGAAFGFTFNDTNAQDSGTITATATVNGTAIQGPTNTITMTPGAVKTITLSSSPSSQVAVPAQTAGTPYTVYVNAFDTWLNPTNPSWSNLAITGTATSASPAPAGQAAVVPAPPPAFSAGQSAVTITSFRAQAAASSGGNLTVACSTNCASGATPGSAAFAIAPATTKQVVARDNSGALISALTITAGGDTRLIHFTIEDVYNNPASTQAGTVHVVLKPGATPDGGHLSGGPNPATPPDTSGPVSLDIDLTQTSQVTYQAPATTPVGGTGTITFSSGTLTSAPASISVTDP